jgi:hypothetical protein
MLEYTVTTQHNVTLEYTVTTQHNVTLKYTVTIQHNVSLEYTVCIQTLVVRIHFKEWMISKSLSAFCRSSKYQLYSLWFDQIGAEPTIHRSRDEPVKHYTIHAIILLPTTL